MPDSSKLTLTPSVESSAVACFVKAAFGSVRIRLKSSTLSELSSTRIGKRPCNSGIKSEGLTRWNAPDAIKRMWSVLTVPYFVETVQPSIKGSKSRCTPSRETSPPEPSCFLATLSISSIKTMPCCSTLSNALALISSWSTSFAASSSVRCLRAFLMDIFFLSFLPWFRFSNIPCNWSVISSIPGMPIISTLGLRMSKSTSISLSSKSPSRSFLRNF